MKWILFLALFTATVVGSMDAYKRLADPDRYSDLATLLFAICMTGGSGISAALLLNELL